MSKIIIEDSIDRELIFENYEDEVLVSLVFSLA